MGIGETQRLVWVMSRPITSTVNLLMTNLTDVDQKTSDQHQKAKNSRRKRDWSNSIKIYEFLKKINPFQGDTSKLRNIVTGVAASSSVNVDTAKTVGEKILEKMNGKSLKEFSPRKVDQCVLMSVKENPNGKKKHNHIDPSLLFQRLLIVAKRSEKDESDFFKFELCSHPLSLFDNNGLLRNADKSQLTKKIVSLAKYDPLTTVINFTDLTSVNYVIDGGSLLHKIKWSMNEEFGKIYERYCSYVLSKYGQATVLFDSYGKPSTKDVTHFKRGRIVGKHVIEFTPSMSITMGKEEFLTCTANKSRFITELGKYLEKRGIKVRHAEGDADLQIVLEAINSARFSDTVLIGDATDLLILLLYYFDSSHMSLYLKCEQRTEKIGAKIFNIRSIRDSIGPDICGLLLFAHAFMGCDTTSKPFGLGKGTGLKCILNNIEEFKKISSVFMNDKSTKDLVTKAGEKAMELIYGGDSVKFVGIDKFRYQIFKKKVATSTTAVQPEEIPPTSAACKYHSWRSFLQV